VEALLKSFAPIAVDWAIEFVDATHADEFSIEPKHGKQY
jgi:hypothetical protein